MIVLVNIKIYAALAEQVVFVAIMEYFQAVAGQAGLQVAAVLG
jgi:hypothetical protein